MTRRDTPRTPPAVRQAARGWQRALLDTAPLGFALEPRFMFDAAGAATGAEVAADQAAQQAAQEAAAQQAQADAQSNRTTDAQPSGATPPSGSDSKTTDPQTPSLGDALLDIPSPEQQKEVVFIDPQVPNFQDLLAAAKPDSLVFVLEADKDGLQQIADILAENHLNDLSAIHIVSHGGAGEIRFGATTVSNANLDAHAGALAAIGAALAPGGDILIYGCDVASGEAGQPFLDHFSSLTGANVAASTDASGAAALGGDWTLEAATGSIEAGLAFTGEGLADYAHLLANETFTANQTTVLFNDLDGDGVIDPGETVTTTVTINNNSDNTDATGVSFTETLDGMTLVPGTINVSPLAFNDSYTTVGNTQLFVNLTGTNPGSTPAAVVTGGLFANDVEFLGDTFTLDGFTQAASGTVAVNGDGSFSYTPDAGFIGTDTFTYTIRDQGIDNIAGNADDLTGVGTVTITVSNMVWYVNNAAGTAGDGTSANPFDSLADVSGATGPDAAGQIIYLHTGSGNYDGGITLLNNQTLWGQNEALAVGGFTLQAAGSDPTIVNSGGSGVTLAQGNTLKGFTVGNTAVADITDGGGTVGSLTISNVNLTGTGQAVDIDQGGTLAVTIDSLTSTSGANGVQLAATGAALTGTFTVTGGAISGSTGAAFLVGDGAGGANTGGTVAISYGGTITSGSARAVDIQDRASGAGNITFSGNITHNVGGQSGIFLDDNAAGTITFSGQSISITSATASGVSLTDNTGATIAFNPAGGGNGLDVSTTSGTGFFATGGGTVTVQGSGNTIVSTTGTALNITNTTIDANDVTFQSISSNGGSATGIILDTTGSSGGLHVTGTGTAGSGGTIANKTGADGATTTGNGIYLNNTSDVRLAWMQLNDFENSAIRGLSVTGFSLEDSVISGTVGSSTAATEGAIAFGTIGVADGLFGSALIDNLNVSGSVEHQIEIYNQSGTLNLTIRNSNIHDNNTSSGADGIQMEFSGTAQAFIDISGNSFSNNRSQAIQVNALDSSNVHLTIDNNTITRGTQGSEGVVLQNGDDADLTTAVTNNDLDGWGGVSIFVGQVAGDASASSLLQATISGNTVTTPTTAANHAIIAYLSSTSGQVSQARILIDGNTVTQNSATGVARGIIVDAPDSGRTPEYHATVTNNIVHVMDNVAGVAGIAVQARNGATGHFDVRNNTVDFPNGTPGGVSGLRVREDSGNGSVAELARGVSGSSDAATVLAANNLNSTTEVLGTVTVINNGVVLTPATPTLPSLPLLAATGSIAPPASGERGSSPPPAGAGGDAATSDEPDAGTADSGDDLSDALTGYAQYELTQAELDAIVAAAIERWAATGLTAQQLAALQTVAIETGDMDGWYLGSFAPGVITIDADAAGYGWYVDATPGDDVEFSGAFGDTWLQTTPTGAPAGHFDLLTAVMHEMGHQLGLEDSTALSDRADLMYAFLVAGERRLPGAGDADGAVAGAIHGEEFLGAPVAIGTLPFGKTATIQWQATVDTQTNQLIVNPQNTGTVSATNAVGFADTNTNTVNTTLDSLALGNLVFNDANTNGVFDSGTESGINGVALTLYADDGATAGAFDAGDTLLATTTTAGGGLYSFSGLAPGDYIVQVDQANFGSGHSLFGLNSSSGAPDPDDNVNNDDNGAPVSGQGVVSAPITLSYNNEPSAGTGNDTNNTLDFGFFAGDPPVLGNGGNVVSYGEQQAAIVLNAAITVSDADAPGSGNQINGATVTIVSGAFAGDVLSAVTSGTNITASFNGTDTLTLSGADTIANYQAVLQSVTYASTSDNPTAFGASPSRVATFLVRDILDVPSTPVATTVNLTAANDAPEATIASTIYTTTEQTTLNLKNTGLSVADPDGASGTATLSVTEGALIVTPGTSAAVVSGSGTSIVTITGTIAQINALLNSDGTSGVGYINNADNPSASATLTLGFDDGGNTGGGALQASDTATINITAVNDAPVATITPASYNATENVALDLKNSGLSVADVDGNNGIETVTLSVTEGILNVTAGTSGASVSNSGTGSVTITGTLAQINALFITDGTSTVSYINNADNPAASATLTLLIDDGGNTGGGALTGSDTATIDIAAVNDAPAATITPASYNATEQVALSLKNNGLAVSDIDGNSGIETVTLSVTEGILNVTAGTSGASVSNSGTGSVTITGTLAQINALLITDGTSTVSYVNNSDNPAASATLTLLIDDGGNTGGGALTGSDTATIDIAPVNDAPAATIAPASYGATENAPLDLKNNGLAVGDIDGNNGTQTVTLSVTEGVLDVTAGTSGVAVVDSGTSSVTITGTIAQINALLNTDGTSTVSYTETVDNPSASVTLTLLIDDGGNTGGGALASNDAATINITAANDAPVATITPANYAATENAALDLKNSGLTVDDVDGNSGIETVTLSVTEGVLDITAGTSGAVVTNSGTASVTIAGTLAQINALLNSDGTSTVSYINDGDNPSASATLTLAVDDGGATGIGGALSASDTATIDITPVNDAPSVTITAASYDATENVGLDLKNTGLSVDDVDGNSGMETATLSVTEGVLNVTPGTSGATVANSGTSSVTITGTLAQINALLNTDAASTVVYVEDNDDPSSGVTLNLAIDDGGSTGGGSLTADGSVTVNITAVNDAPIIDGPAGMTVEPETSMAFTGLNAIVVGDPDAGTGPLTVTVTLTGNAQGQLAGPGATASGLILTGTLAQINAALAGLQYVAADGGPGGTDTITVIVNDGGNPGTGPGAGLSATWTMNIAVPASPPQDTTTGDSTTTGPTATTTGSDVSFLLTQDGTELGAPGGTAGGTGGPTGTVPGTMDWNGPPVTHSAGVEGELGANPPSFFGLPLAHLAGLPPGTDLSSVHSAAELAALLGPASGGIGGSGIAGLTFFDFPLQGLLRFTPEGMDLSTITDRDGVLELIARGSSVSPDGGAVRLALFRLFDRLGLFADGTVTLDDIAGNRPIARFGMSVSEILERLPAGLDISQVQNLDSLARLLAQNAWLDHAAEAGPGAPGAESRVADPLPTEAGFVAFGEQLAAAGMAFDLHAQRLGRAFAETDLRHVA